MKKILTVKKQLLSGLTNRLSKSNLIALVLFASSLTIIGRTDLQAQCMLVPAPLQELVVKSNVVIEAKVIEKKCFEDPNYGIKTAYLLDISKVFKGSFSNNFAVVVADGGTIGTNTLQVYPGFEMNLGDQGVFCLNPLGMNTPFGAANIFRAYSGAQGFIRYDEHQIGAKGVFDTYESITDNLLTKVQSFAGRTYNVIKQTEWDANQTRIETVHADLSAKSENTGTMAPAITSLSPLTVKRGDNVTINGTDFGAKGANSMVFFASNFPNEQFIGYGSSIVSWTSTRIVVKVPFDVKTGIVIVRTQSNTQLQSAQTLTINPATVVTPTISSMPASGAVGDQIVINGTKFLGFERPMAIFFSKAGDSPTNPTLQVSNSDIISLSDTRITVKIPRGAVTGKFKFQNRTMGTVMRDFSISAPGQSGAMNITSLSPTSINAGLFEELTINGTGFGANQGTIGFPNADDGGATTTFFGAPYIVSWSNTQIKVKVPSNAGTGRVAVKLADASNTVTSASNLTINFAVLNSNIGNSVQSVRLINHNGNGGYTFKVAQSFAANAPAMAAMKRALESWRCSTGVNFSIDPIPAANNDCNNSVSDGIHTIAFDGPCQLGNANTLGTCFSRRSSCQESGTSAIVDLDLIMDSPGERNWNFGPQDPTAGQSDFESVVLHELGHGHGLGHVIDGNKVMNFSITTGTKKRVLSASSDIAGGNRIIDLSTGSNCFNRTGMVRLLNAECRITNQGAASEPPMANFHASMTSGCAPMMVKFTDLSQNEPDMWEWDVNGDGMTDYTEQNIEHTYTMPGVYSVMLKVSNLFGDNVKTMFRLIKVAPMLDLKVSQEKVNVCKGEMVSLEAMGAPNYVWTPSMGMMNTGSKFTFMATNSTTITLTGSNGTCTEMRKIMVNVMPNPMATTDITHAMMGNNGTIRVNAMGGMPPYMYALQGQMPQSSNMFKMLAPGNYSIHIMDANGCKGMVMATVNNSGEMPKTCMAPMDVKAMANGTMIASVMWKPTMNANGYEVYYRPSGNTGDWWSKKTDMPHITIEGLKPGMTYEFKVRAMCGNMWSDYSMSAMAMTESNMMCMAPMFSVDKVTSMMANIMWKDGSMAKNYTVYYRSMGSMEWMSQMAGGMEHMAMLRNLMPSTNYEVKIKAWCSTENWAETPVRMFTTLGEMQMCMPVMNLMAMPKMTEAQLSWTANENATNYVVYWKSKMATKWMSRTLSPLSNSLMVTSLEPGKMYEVMVKTNCNGVMSDATMATFTTMTARELENSSLASDIQALPNPNNGSFDLLVFSDNTQTAVIKLLDLAGKTIWTQTSELVAGSNRVAIQTETISKGVYFLKVDGINNAKAIKVIIE